MYKEPMISKETNEVASKRIDQKIKETLEKLSSEQGDTDFMGNLHDLCVLNRMADSHDG